MTEKDYKVADAMKKYGGSFVQCLGEACHCADEINLQKIKDTWPDYWNTYKNL
jgi:hypothetical protein